MGDVGYGEKIKELRTRLGLSQDEFARLLGIHKQNVSDVERGKQRRFRPEVEQKLKELFGFDPFAEMGKKSEDGGMGSGMENGIDHHQEQILLYYFRKIPPSRRDILFLEMMELALSYLRSSVPVS